MKYITLLFLFIASACAEIVPYFNDPRYTRDEPTSPPWYVFNDGRTTSLFYDGVVVSQESGTYSLNLLDAWAIQATGCKVGLIDTKDGHGARSVDCLRTVSPQSEFEYVKIPIWYGGLAAIAITNLVDHGCRIISIPVGWTLREQQFGDACLYAASNNVIICCSMVNDSRFTIDVDMTDYPYSYHYPNTLPVYSLDRAGIRYWSAFGSLSIGAPGRNIVAAGTFSSGTSWAAPITAGCAALLIANDPTQTAEQIIARIRNNTDGGKLNIVRALISQIKDRRNSRLTKPLPTPQP